MISSWLAMTMALAMAADNPPRPATDNPARPSAVAGTVNATVPYCVVMPIERQEVPGADAGVLMELNVKEGTPVTKGMVLARVDDREAKAMLTVKQLEAEAAEQEANSDIGVRYQQATSDVAEQAYKKLIKANEGSKGAVSEIEVLRTLLEWRKADLGILKEKEASATNRLTADAKKAEVDAAQVSASRRILRAEFDGVVLSVKKHVGDWVAAGEPVIEIARVDRLSIRGNVAASEWTRQDLEGKNVSVDFKLPRDRVEKLPGKVVFVSPVVVGDEISVWAEVDVPKGKDGSYVVPAGLTATMTVHVTPPKPEPKPPIAPRGKAPDSKATTKS
jgi:multidrug efflux pump subunit AcrA (membrane-fusion protein)